MRNGGQVADPVLERLSNITAMDAVLNHDAARMRDDATLDEYPNPRRPDWPQADYIVGNPPFIGGKDVRARLGAGYATALWKAHPKINKSADFVMYWWDRAAERLTDKGTLLKRFGFVTTNSITQEFSRRVMAARMDARAPISLVMAIPDHPWTKATKDAAAVRIAMTVGEAGTREGVLYEVSEQSRLDTDAPNIELVTRAGEINSDLSIGSNVTDAVPLLSNEWLCSPGVKLHGPGFIVTRAEAQLLGLGSRANAELHVREYRNGRDLTAKSRDKLVLDMDGLSAEDVRRNFPEIYQHLLVMVKPERDLNNEPYRRDNWWLFGRRNTIMRGFTRDTRRYIVTVETAKHRIFQFLSTDILPDNKLICFGLPWAADLGILQCNIHIAWYLGRAGMMGVYDRPAVYVKTLAFDPFPFPDATSEQRQIIGDLAEELDATRKEVLAENADLTLTGLYNLREKLCQHGPLTDVEQDQRRRGRIDIITELHDGIDAAVADAYGWPRDLTDEQIITRLVALNAERHAEERAGKVRWLRPDYQIAKTSLTALPAASMSTQIEALLPQAKAKKTAFPREPIGQTAAVLADLRGSAALTSTDIARRYTQGLKAEPRIAATLAALARLGHVAVEGGHYTLRRAA